MTPIRESRIGKRKGKNLRINSKGATESQDNLVKCSRISMILPEPKTKLSIPKTKWAPKETSMEKGRKEMMISTRKKVLLRKTQIKTW